MTQRYHYLPYGGAFGTAPNGPGYAGNVMDSSGLTYMQARYYDPQLGRFLSTDPAEPDSQTGTNFNRYAYANSNPYRYFDPDGRCASSDLPSATDDGLPCPGEAAPSVVKDALDTVDSVSAAMGPIGVEVSGVERAGVAAAAEVGKATSELIEGVEAAAQGIATAESAANVANGVRLSRQLTLESANSAFSATGELSKGAITGATKIIDADKLGNAAIPEGFSKFVTETFASPSGPFEVHFYMNAGEVYYGLDYKVVFSGGP